MAQNDDYNPENDPKYAVDKAMADREYWRLRRQQKRNQPISPGSVGIPKRYEFEGTPNFLAPEVISVGSIGITRRQDLEQMQKAGRLFMAANFVRVVESAEINIEDLGADHEEKARLLRTHYDIDTRNLTRVQVGRILKQNYDRDKRTVNPKDDTVPF